MTNYKTIKVVAAIIRDGDRIFAAQRGYGDYKDGWEFPGGKVEASETPRDALVREIREELDADIIVGDLLTTVEYDYPDFHLSMDCFWATLVPGSSMKLLEHEAAKWLTIDNIDSVDWLPADVEVVKKIKASFNGEKGCFMSNTSCYYIDNSEEFFESTVNADVSPLYEHFLKYVPDGGYILDFGCGSGRDTKAFLDMGYKVDAIDGSEELCKLASEYAGVEVKCMDFMDLDEVGKYDAIWACASVLHVKGELFPDLFTKMRDSVVDNGIIYMSFKYGESDIERDGRYFTDMTSEKFSKYLDQITGLSVVEEWFSEDVRKEKSLGWYNVILRKG